MDRAHGGHQHLKHEPELRGPPAADGNDGNEVTRGEAAARYTGAPPADTFGTVDTAPSQEMSLEQERDLIRFNVLRNALYHTARRRTFERWNRVFNFLVVVLGAATVGDVLAQYGVSQSYIGMAVALIGAAQLVFDFGRQARDHQALQKDYYTILADIDAAVDPTAEQCAEWRSRQILVTADEPPVLRAVDAKAYNDALDASGAYDDDQRLVIPAHHRLLAGYLSFDGRRYDKISEVNERLEQRRREKLES